MSGSRSGWRRVAITDPSTVNPLGLDVAAWWDAPCAGRCGIGPIEPFGAGALRVRFAGEVERFDLDLARGGTVERRGRSG
jgi:3-oxoacyl-(acyl-carrier-protein) synthase